MAASFLCLQRNHPSHRDEQKLPLGIVRKCLIRCGLSPHLDCLDPPNPIPRTLLCLKKQHLAPFGKLGPPSAFIPGEDFPTH
jgi:hypothetical protein